MRFTNLVPQGAFPWLWRWGAPLPNPGAGLGAGCLLPVTGVGGGDILRNRRRGSQWGGSFEG